jgi:hypothetical protein
MPPPDPDQKPRSLSPNPVPLPQAAAEKYSRAYENMKAGTAPLEVELRRSCVLNLSSCYLNLREYDR